MGTWNSVRRGLYFTQRFMGDVSAARRGTLGKRLVRRSLTRTLFRWGRSV
jgi:hypothetical protein